jgi:hypothetical protein
VATVSRGPSPGWLLKGLYQSLSLPIFLSLAHLRAQIPVDADTKRRIADGLQSATADPSLFAAACARCELDIGGDSLRRFRESPMLAHALTAHAMGKPSTSALMPAELSWQKTPSQQQRPQQQPQQHLMPHLMPQPRRASSWWLACVCADDGRDGSGDTRTAPLVLSPRVAFG